MHHWSGSEDTKKGQGLTRLAVAQASSSPLLHEKGPLGQSLQLFLRLQLLNDPSLHVGKVLRELLLNLENVPGDGETEPSSPGCALPSAMGGVLAADRFTQVGGVTTKNWKTAWRFPCYLCEVQ